MNEKFKIQENYPKFLVTSVEKSLRVPESCMIQLSFTSLIIVIALLSMFTLLI